MKKPASGPEPSNRFTTFLRSGDAAHCLTVLDMDGTIHQGLPVLNYRGYSNLELVYELMAAGWRKPLHNVATTYAMLLIQVYDIHLLLKKRLGIISMSERDGKLVQRFIQTILPRFDEPSIRSAAQRLPRYAFPAFFPALRSLSRFSSSVAFITKGFRFVVQAYANRCDLLTSSRVAVIGNDLDWKSGCPKLDGGSVILTGDDKVKALLGQLKAFNGVRRVVIFGDTEEDAGMIKAARDRLGGEQVFAVAVRPKDPIIRQVADWNIDGWRRIEQALAGLNHQSA